MVAHARAVRLEGQLLKLVNSEDTRDTQFWLERLHGTRFADPKTAVMVNIQQNNTIVPGLNLPEEVLQVLRAKLDQAGSTGQPGVLNPGSALKELLNEES
jgi:hypothetical protein